MSPLSDSEETTPVTPMSVRLIGAFCLVTALGILGHAFILGLHFEDTPRAMADSARASDIAIPAALGAVLAIAALTGASRGWARLTLVAAVLVTGYALTVDLFA